MQNLINDILNHDPKVFGDHFVDEIIRRRQARLARIMKQNARFASWLASISEECAEKVERAEAEGWKVNKVIRDNTSHNVAVLLVKQVWNSKKARVCPNLRIVYPDGSLMQTAEKSISVKAEF